MKPFMEKVLKSGLVKRGTVELLEKWGNLPEGATDLVKEEFLKGCTQSHLTEFAERVADEIEAEHTLRETNLDLGALKWPSVVTVISQYKSFPGPKESIYNIPSMIDRMGRLFFRVEDVDESWFIPGYRLSRKQFNRESKCHVESIEEVLEVQPLYVGDQKIALQVTVQRLD